MGTLGLEMVQTHRPDLVTLDLHMPDVDGWEVLRRLKADPGVSHIPVVIASVAANEGRGRLFGAVDLLTKPIERSDLLRVLWRQLVNQHGRRILLVDDDPEIQTVLRHGLAVDDLGSSRHRHHRQTAHAGGRGPIGRQGIRRGGQG